MMIKIDMDNGKRYTFGEDDYDNYFVNEQFIVIEKDHQWFGCFALSHMIGFFVDKED